jgi:cytochrome P450
VIEALRRDPLGWPVSAYRRHGPVWEHGDTTYVAGLDANRDVWLDTSAWSYRDSAAVFREVFSDRYLTQLDGEPHLAKRRMLAPAFRARAMQEREQDMVAAIERSIPAASIDVDLVAWARRLIVRLAGAALVRVDLPATAEREIAAFERDLLRGATMGDRRHAWFARPDAQRRKAAVLGRFERIVRARLADPSGDDLLSGIIREHPDVPADELVGDLVLLMQAGSFTTAHLVAWAIVLLAGEDRRWDRIADDDTALLAAVTETERLRPPVPFGFRVAARDVDVAGVTIPAGRSVTHCHAVTHFLAEHYDDSHEFRPERFVDRTPEPFVHGTFGGGRHLCIGQPLARLEATLVLGTIARTHRVELVAPHSLDARFDGVLTFARPRPHVRFVPR